MNDGGLPCTCANDGYLDWLMRRAAKRPALRRPRPAPRRVPNPHPSPLHPGGGRPLPVAGARAGRLPPAPTAPPGRVRRRAFLKGLAVGAGLLAWQGLPRPARADGPDCGGQEGDPTWDWTFALGTG